MSAFANQVVLITGAGSGLGYEMARQLSDQGAAVAAVDRSGDGLLALAKGLDGRPLRWAVADVTDRPGLQAAVAELAQALGPIDVLIASAGIGRENSALVFSAADLEEQVRVNLVGVANSVEAVLPGMVARRRGHLVAVSSLASYRGLPKMLGYCASKAGVNALMEGLRVELQPHGIAVTTVCPGWVRTPLTAGVQSPMPNLLAVEDAAREIVEAVRRKKPFHAFPRWSVRHMRLLRWLPCRWSDGLLLRSLRRLGERRA